MPESLQSRIEAAILPGLSAVTPLAGASPITGLLLLGALSVVGLAIGAFGIAGWRARSSWQLGLDFAPLSTGLFLLARTLAVRMMPGSGHTHSILLYIAAPLLAMFTLEAVMFGDQPNPRFVHLSLACWSLGLACAAIAAPVFGYVLRRGFWLNGASLAAAAGLLAGLVGAAALALHCAYLDRLHIISSHLGAALTASMLGAGIGLFAARRSARLSLDT